jgi:Dolichyl-phosphate-mannose-protein mannosyltransferase
MIYFALILAGLLGLSVINLISRDFHILEKIGFSFLVGIGIETVFMFVLDVMGIRFTGGLLLLISIVCIAVLNYKLILAYKSTFEKIWNLNFKIPGLNPQTLSLVWILFLVLTVIVTYGSFAKSLFWPTSAYDNVAGFDLMGKVMASEGKIHNSLFEINGTPIDGSARRLIYPPLVSGSFAYAYLFGLHTSKIMTSLIFVFFVIAFYSALRRYANRTNSMVFTFFTVVTPEMFAFSSLSTTNVPFAIYSSLGLVYLYFWVDKREVKDLLMASVMIGLSGWARSEGIICVGVGSLAVLYTSVRSRNWKHFIVYNVIALAAFLSWNIYVKLKFNIDQSVFVPHPFWDYEKLSAIVGWVKNLITDTNLYGISFYVFVIMILVNAKNLYERDQSLNFLILILAAFLLYTFLYYQMDNTKMNSLDVMMKTSYRRGLFFFIPLIWFFVSTNKVVRTFFSKYIEFE